MEMPNNKSQLQGRSFIAAHWVNVLQRLMQMSTAAAKMVTMIGCLCSARACFLLKQCLLIFKTHA